MGNSHLGKPIISFRSGTYRNSWAELGVVHPKPFNFRSFSDHSLVVRERSLKVTSHDRETFERHFAMSERDFGRMSESFCDHERLVIALTKYGLGASERRTATNGMTSVSPK